MFARYCTCWILAMVAIAWLSRPAAAQATTSPVRLQSLVNDAVAQLQIAYRHDAAERRDRYEQVAAAVESWRRAERSKTNNRLLADWLRAAMRASMPGSRAALPPAPPFAGGPDYRSMGDPFGDDLQQE
jgi:hypothetical protein